MLRLKNLARRLVRDTRGATAIEYGLIIALVTIGFLAALQALGDGNSASWGRTANKVTGAMQNSGQ
jgi:pilus assembly protein Flp/PilA